jgi:Flp pilus assembly secretin CpaC
VLGALFGVKREQERHTELAIFVTPMIVDPRDPGLAARIANAQGVLQESFPGAPTLNTPLNHVEPSELNTPRNTFEGQGQWESDLDNVQPMTNSLSQWEDAPTLSQH